MSEREIKEMVKGLKAYKKKVTASKEASRNFLIELGVVDKDGNRTEPYKHLPTPTGPRAPCTCESGFCKVGSDPGCGGGLASRIENPQCDDGLENEDPGDASADDRIDFAGLDQNGDGVFDWNAGDRLRDLGCRFPWNDNESPECNDRIETTETAFSTSIPRTRCVMTNRWHPTTAKPRA